MISLEHFACGSAAFLSETTLTKDEAKEVLKNLNLLASVVTNQL